MISKFCKRCGKVLPKYNRTDFCRRCYFYTKNKEYIEKRKSDRLCIVCKKPIEPVYPIRCKECRKKQAEYSKKWKLKRKT